jgi:2-keto-4-pentenoate hydratase/2-oxohepta-3-ene-1,7-dioic acid hydratase in catechol pathway
VPSQRHFHPIFTPFQAPSDQNFNIELEVGIQGEGMEAPHTVTKSNLKYLYYSMAQQLVHHSVTGCNMCPGDLLGSVTPTPPALYRTVNLNPNSTASRC